jgi:hypothetical protein
VLLHPDIVPGEHRDRGEQHGRVEQLLSHPGDRIGDRPGERGHQRCADHAAADSRRHPQSAPRDATRSGHHDADDERRFENLAEDDDPGCQHAADSPFLLYLAMIWIT